MDVRAWAGVPLRTPTGQILGTVCVVDTVPRAWTRDDADTLTELAGIATDEIAARQTAWEALDSRTILEQVLARSPIGFALLDDDLRFLMINEAPADLNGMPVADHIGRGVAELLADVAGAVEPLLKSVLTTGESIDGVGLAAASTRLEIGNIIGTLVADYFDGSFAAAGSLEPDGRTVQVMTDPGNHTLLDQVELDFTKRSVYGEAFRTGPSCSSPTPQPAPLNSPTRCPTTIVSTPSPPCHSVGSRGP